jgi:hypothetical protein
MNAICHCDNCKRRTGSAFGWSVYYREDEVTARGALAATYASVSASGPAERHFCRNCGTTVYWRASVFPGLVGVAGGAVEGIGEPTLSASEAGKCAWLGLPDGWQHVS